VAPEALEVVPEALEGTANRVASRTSATRLISFILPVVALEVAPEALEVAPEALEGAANGGFEDLSHRVSHYG
jgi:hypothetical protein